MKKGKATIHFSSLHFGKDATWAVELKFRNDLNHCFSQLVNLNDLERIAANEYETFRNTFEKENIRQGSKVEYMLEGNEVIAIKSKLRNKWLNLKGAEMSI